MNKSYFYCVLSLLLFTNVSFATAEINWNYEFSNESWKSDWWVSHGEYYEKNGVLVSSQNCYNEPGWGCWNYMWRNHTEAFGNWKVAINADNATQYEERSVFFIYFVGVDKDPTGSHPEIGYLIYVNVYNEQVTTSWRDPSNISATGFEDRWGGSSSDFTGWQYYDIRRYEDGLILILLNGELILEFANKEVNTSQYIAIAAIQGLLLDNISFTGEIPSKIGDVAPSSSIGENPFNFFMSASAIIVIIIIRIENNRKTRFTL